MVESNNAKTALLISTLSSFMTPIMASAINIALPDIGKEYSLDAIAISWIATSYLLAAAVFLIPFGRLADMYGRKKIFIYGITIYSLFSLIIPVSHSGMIFILFRIFQGIGASMIFSTGLAIISSAVEPAKRGKYLGINVSAVYLGLTLGPFIGGLLTQHLGWRSIFFANGLVGLVILILIVKKLHGEWAGSEKLTFDLSGSVLFAVSLSLIMYGFSHLPRTDGVLTVGIGSIFFVLFLIRERKVADPLIDIGLFRGNSVYAFSNLAALINYSATFAVTFLLSLYLQYIRGLDPQKAGIILVAQPLMMAVISPWAGRLADKKEPRIIASAGMMLTVLGLIFFIFIDESTDIYVIVVNLLFLGIGFGLFSSPNTSAVMGSVEKEYYGIASAMLGTMRLTGQMLSMGIVAMILSLSMGKVKISPENYGDFLQSMKLMFIIFSIICVFGIFASLARGKTRSD